MYIETIINTHIHTHIYIYIYIYTYHILCGKAALAKFERRIWASGTFFGLRLGADRISASTNSSAEFRRQAHFRLQAGGRPNFSFNEFEHRISASGTFSASGWGPTEFQLQRIRAPNFGVRHLFGFRLGADRISASANSSAEFPRQAPFRLKAEFRLQRRI